MKINNSTPMSSSGINIESGIKHIGIKRTISISKTKKITASKKNRVEKGNRAVFMGSNPHSKGDDLFRSIYLRADNSRAIEMTAAGIINEIKEKIKVKIINQRLIW